MKNLLMLVALMGSLSFGLVKAEDECQIWSKERGQEGRKELETKAECQAMLDATPNKTWYAIWNPGSQQTKLTHK